MKRLILIFFVVALLAALAAPFIEGYWFKQMLMKRFSPLAIQLSSTPAKDVKIEFSEYRLGWLQSTAVITLTEAKNGTPVGGGFQMPPIIFKYEMVIHHGPIVFVDGKPKLAMANVEMKLILPDVLKIFWPDNGTGFLQAQSLVSLDGNTVNSHVNIPGQNILGMVKWDGLSGDNTLTFANDSVIKSDTDITIGSVISEPSPDSAYIPRVVIESTIIESKAELMPSGLWGGTFKASTAGIGLQGINNKAIIAYDIKTDYTYGEQASLYDIITTLSFGKIMLPANEVINAVNNVNYSLAVKNINAPALYDLTQLIQAKPDSRLDYKKLSQQFLKLLSPTFSVTSSLASTTNLGNEKIDLTIGFSAPPTTPDELIKNVNINLSARAAAPLIESLINMMMKEKLSANQTAYSQGMQSAPRPQPTPADIAQMTKGMIDSYIQQGIIKRDNNDYVIAFVKKGESFILNGVDVTQSVMQLQQHGMTGFGLSPQKDYYVQIVSATAPYRVAVNECAKTLGTIVGCNAGSNRIPAAITTPTGVASSLTVVDGVITIAPVEANGVLATDTYVLTPSRNADGSIIWIASGPGVMKGYAR